MTDAQEAAFDKAQQLLREHFSAAVVLATVTPADSPNPTEDRHMHYWDFHGGEVSALGLLKWGELQVTARMLTQSMKDGAQE